MSVQFGRWSFDGAVMDPRYLVKVNEILKPYGPDGKYEYSSAGVRIVYLPFHTTKESWHETQPYVSCSGAVLTWDGRLDNSTELIGQLGGALCRSSTDVAIVAAAYDRWGTEAFSKLVGDWALSLWSHSRRELILAKDFLGGRHLYYSLDARGLTWSSVLDPLVLLAERFPAIEEEYIAGWLGSYPGAQLTPFREILDVSPAGYLLVRNAKPTTHIHTKFDPEKHIRYRREVEYEEQFRELFSLSVARRLRSDSPILAELSGGIDSSSIVCVADRIIAEGGGETPWLDTISYYDDSEPDWNERPYFTRIERNRGREGTHVDFTHKSYVAAIEFEEDRFASTPCSGLRRSHSQTKFACCVRSKQSRVVLSGTGGDEVTGGVPSPYPELANYLATAKLLTLAHQAKLWALAKRKPWLRLLSGTFRCFLADSGARSPDWLTADFAKRHRAAATGYRNRRTILGPLPSFQENLQTLDSLRRELSCSAPLAPDALCEWRYPYLDRDLLEFLFAIPPEQIVRPGQRRSLMRRALAGIVPNEILNRPRKTFVARRHIVELRERFSQTVEAITPMACDQLGIVNEKQFVRALGLVDTAQNVPIVPILRTLHIEAWLRHLSRWNESLWRNHGDRLGFPSNGNREVKGGL
jgi:asparagine synthase (glutamine-hydrolysing)